MNSEVLHLMNKLSKIMFFGILMSLVCYSFSIAEEFTQQRDNKSFEKTTKNFFQSRNITGRITSVEDGESLPGVNIIEKGTNNGVVTDVDGVYSLNVNEGATLVFSSVGYVTEEVEVGERTVIDLVMTMNIQQLNELVVVGYGVQEKKLVTGATTQVKGEDIQKLSTVSPLTAMQSQAPGVSIIATSSRPDADFKVNIRGLGTIGDSEPLIVINGIIGGDLNSLSPFDIESIDILKDAASAAIYGSRAANGVILITTKQGKAGKPTITYDMNYGVQNVYKYLDMVNAQDYMALVNESVENSG
ncbi:MAG: TonB-dependent receptor plug domain-containing protein, partial [Cyclobacteriaceae bacterium]